MKKTKLELVNPDAVSEFSMRARVLVEALPFMQRYSGKIVVVKIGGRIMGDARMVRNFARDIVLLKQAGIQPVVVHGGGPQINEHLKQLGLDIRFESGLRVTDRKSMQVVEMILAGSMNKDLVSGIQQAGGIAIGLCGKDANILIARKLRKSVWDSEARIERIVDLGFVGEPAQIQSSALLDLMHGQIIPILAPIAADKHGETFNINADSFASAIAGDLKAERLIVLTDVDGVLDASGQLCRTLNEKKARSMISDGTISVGMIPKVETSLNALNAGVEGVVLLNGARPHAVLMELLTAHGAGTLFERD